MENGGHGCLGNNASLKDFCQFTDDFAILDKSSYHRNQNVDFAEKKGIISDDALSYAGLDVKRAKIAIFLGAEQLGVLSGCLATTMAQPKDSIHVAVKAYCESAHLSISEAKSILDPLSPKQVEMVTNLRSAAPSIRRRMAGFQKKALLARYVKEATNSISRFLMSFPSGHLRPLPPIS